ncbi:MAG: LemA family protein [Verrucomicrobiota bacterium]
MEALIALAVVVGLPLLFVLVQYNSLVALRQYIRNSWSNIDTELKRRHDLIPNLVATVKGYAQHERETLENVTELRNRCLAGHTTHAEVAADENALASAVQRLLVVAENYPDLKADQNFLQLQKELVNTEDRIQAARRFYNGNVRDYLTKCQSFPSNLIAGMFGFKPEDYLAFEPAVREVPNVNF